MGHSNGIITAPVGIDANIAPVLGVGSYDLGYICSNAHGKINKWSRKKPVIRKNMLSTDGTNDWWKADNGFCGLTVPRISGADIPLLETATWGYAPPTGGDAAPFRATDFDGYDHNARPQYIAVFQKYITKQEVSAAVLITENFTPGSLLLKEVMGRELTDVYIGVMLTNTTGGTTYTYYYSTEQPITAGGNLIIGVDGNNANLVVGRKYKAVLFLCTAKLGSSGYISPWTGTNMVWAFPDNTYYSRIGSIEVRQKETIEDYLNITSWKSVIVAHSSIKFTVVIKNVSTVSRTFKRRDIKCTYNIMRTYGTDWTNVFKERQLLFNAQADTQNYSINAGQSIEFSGEIQIDWGGAYPLKWYGNVILELLGSSGKYDALGGYNELSYGM